MNTPARQTNAVAASDKSKEMLTWLNSPSTKGELSRACAKHITPDRMARVVLTACNRQPKLLACTKTSLWQAILDCASMGLEPDAWGRAYLVPYGDQCQLIIGYKGLVELAMRSGRVRSIKAEVVYERDAFTYSFGLSEKLEHVPAMGERGNPTHVYAYAIMANEGHAFEVMTVKEVEKVRTRSRASGNGPWQTDWEMMARKTAIRRLAKLLPLSSEFRDATERDADAEPVDFTIQTPEQSTDTTAEVVQPAQQAGFEQGDKQ